jgi:hypothetical protein
MLAFIVNNRQPTWQIKEERLLKHCIVVSCEKHIRKVGGITILPWGDFITALWQNGLQEV